ncbi:hypothetical protein R1flu_023371 [Riccia fluitans]|uniref:Secreted protein n=1 Tax=Riccia fluitans TaxID=41844 RepID=A0ABD1XRV6_9MARC
MSASTVLRSALVLVGINDLSLIRWPLSAPFRPVRSSALRLHYSFVLLFYERRSTFLLLFLRVTLGPTGAQNPSANLAAVSLAERGRKAPGPN